MHKNPVTLTVEEAERLMRYMGDMASKDWDHSRRTASASIREHCIERATWLRDMEALMVRRLYNAELS